MARTWSATDEALEFVGFELRRSVAGQLRHRFGAEMPSQIAEALAQANPEVARRLTPQTLSDLARATRIQGRQAEAIPGLQFVDGDENTSTALYYSDRNIASLREALSNLTSAAEDAERTATVGKFSIVMTDPEDLRNTVLRTLKTLGDNWFGERSSGPGASYTDGAIGQITDLVVPEYSSRNIKKYAKSLLEILRHQEKACHTELQRAVDLRHQQQLDVQVPGTDIYVPRTSRAEKVHSIADKHTATAEVLGGAIAKLKFLEGTLTTATAKGATRDAQALYEAVTQLVGRATNEFEESVARAQMLEQPEPSAAGKELMEKVAEALRPETIGVRPGKYATEALKILDAYLVDAETRQELANAAGGFLNSQAELLDVRESRRGVVAESKQLAGLFERLSEESTRIWSRQIWGIDPANIPAVVEAALAPSQRAIGRSAADR